MFYFVTLPFNTYVKNKFLYFKSFADIELKNISLSFWRFYYIYDYPSIILSKSIYVCYVDILLITYDDELMLLKRDYDKSYYNNAR